jgi:predicted membrane-bound spermidine synthase
LLGLVLLGGILLGSNLCRWLLILAGLLVALGIGGVLSEPPDLDVIAWTLTALLVTGLLFAPSVRAHTRRC